MLGIVYFDGLWRCLADFGWRKKAFEEPYLFMIDEWVLGVISIDALIEINKSRFFKFSVNLSD